MSDVRLWLELSEEAGEVCGGRKCKSGGEDGGGGRTGVRMPVPRGVPGAEDAAGHKDERRGEPVLPLAQRGLQTPAAHGKTRDLPQQDKRDY